MKRRPPLKLKTWLTKPPYLLTRIWIHHHDDWAVVHHLN